MLSLQDKLTYCIPNLLKDIEMYLNQTLKQLFRITESNKSVRFHRVNSFSL